MRNAKKTLSLVMVAIFTTFIVLSGIPAGAATKAQAKAQVTKATAAVVKVEKTVKVTTFNVTTAQTQLNAAAKEVAKVKNLGKTYTVTYKKLVARDAVVAKKIAARKAAIAKAAAALAKLNKDAEAAVAAAEKATDGDVVDLVGDAAALANAQGTVTAALELIVKLDNSTAAYKGLMARIDAANNLIVKAMDEIAAAEEAARLAAEAEAAAKAAVDAAEKAVAAVEAAPLATATDLAAAVELGKTAVTAVAAVTDTEKAAAFTARLKVMADKGLALEAKLAADAEALKPAKIVTVSAVDGTITVTFDKKPLTTVAAVDFTVVRTVTTTGAVSTPVAITNLTVVSDTAITFTVPALATSTTDQTVVYSVQYTTGTAVATAPTTVAKSILTATLSANNYKTAYVKFNKAVDPDTITATNVKVYLGTNTTASVVDTDVEYVMSDDNTMLYLVFTNGLLSANKSIKVVIDGVTSETNAADKITASTSTVVVNDITIPTLTSAVAKNVKTLVLTFNEPIANGATTFAQILANVKVDGVSIIGTVTADNTANTLTIVLTSALAAGTHTVTTTGLRDYAGYAVVDTTNTVTAVADTTLPAITSAAVVDRNTISLTFNKELAVLGTYTVNGVTVPAVAGATANIVTLTVPTLGLDAIVQVVVTYNGTADVVGNTVSTATTYTFKTADDTTLPTVTASLDGEDTLNQVTLTFSKPMQPGVGTFTIINSTGTVSAPIAIPAAGAAWNTARTTVTLSPALLGWTAVSSATYTLDITGMKDNSIRANAMLEAKLAVTTVDSKVPTVLSIVKKQGTTAALDTLTVYFSEAMNATLLTNESNYGITAGATQPLSIIADASVSSIASDNKSVVLIVPNSYANVTSVSLYALSDLAGNALASTPNPVGTAPAVTVSSVKATGTSTIKMVFNAPLATFDPSAFKVQVGTADTFTFSGAALSTTTETNDTLTLTVNGSLKANAAQYTLVPTTNFALITNVYGTAMLSNVVLPAFVTDGITPSVSSVVAGDALDTAATTATPNTFSVTFTEALGGGVTTANVANEVVVKDASGAILNANDFTVTTTDNKTFKFVINPAAADVTTGVNNYTVSIPVPRTLVDTAANLVNVYAGTTITVTVQ